MNINPTRPHDVGILYGNRYSFKRQLEGRIIGDLEKVVAQMFLRRCKGLISERK